VAVRRPSSVIAAALAALLVLCAPAAAQDGPPLSVPADELAAALECPQPLAGATRAPVLLIPGTNLEPRANFDWNYEPALTAAGIPWCALTLPRYGMGDVQVAAEYVVAALRRMYAESGRRVSIVGFSQGGMIGRWALRWWPDTRSMVEDLVGNAPSNHGTQSARELCRTSCPPAYWQQRDTAKFIEALNSGGETFAGIDYTVNFTRYDEVVTPNADAETGSSALRTGDGRVRNTLIQDVCPANTAEHLVLGSYDPVGWALAIDALTHDGPADPGRIDATVCAQPFMPGVSPVTFAADYARYSATIGQAAAQSEYVTEEPPLRCYVTGTCGSGPGGPGATDGPSGDGGSSGAGAARRCGSRRRFTIHLDRRFRRARVTVGAKRTKVRRRRGRLVATVDLRGRPAGIVRVRIRAVTKGGRRITQTRRYRTCGF
jgi:pimeloyl-ACP methyl ester carboxylesterase